MVLVDLPGIIGVCCNGSLLLLWLILPEKMLGRKEQIFFFLYFHFV